MLQNWAGCVSEASGLPGTVAAPRAPDTTGATTGATIGDTIGDTISDTTGGQPVSLASLLQQAQQRRR